MILGHGGLKCGDLSNLLAGDLARIGQFVLFPLDYLLASNF